MRPGGSGAGDSNPDLPEELVQVSVLHVLKDHDEGVPIATHPVELDYVLMLQVGEQLGLPLKILPGGQGGVLQGLEQCRTKAVLQTEGRGLSVPLLRRTVVPLSRPCRFPTDKVLVGSKDPEARSQPPGPTPSSFRYFHPHRNSNQHSSTRIPSTSQ